jgi:hypothetical protein
MAQAHREKLSGNIEGGKLMGCPLNHVALGFKAPHAEPRETIRYVVRLGVEDGKVRLTMRQEGCEGQDFIAIKEDAMVEIDLEGDQIFFSKQYDAITMKGDWQHFYGGLIYDGYNKAARRYTKVRFAARFNRGGKADTCHPFNINVDLKQDDAKGEPNWIPLTIDPDIRNPPPTDG